MKWRTAMKKIPILFILIAFMFSAYSFSSVQEYKGRARLKGKVYDEEGLPIDGVKVRLIHSEINDGIEVKTDSEGRWVASWIKGGVWNIDFEKAGFVPKKISVKIKESTRNPEIDVELEKIEGMAFTKDLRQKLDQANRHYEEGKFDDAIKEYTSILEKFPDAYIVNANIGNVYFKKGNYDMAIQNYLKVLENDPGNNEVKIYIGNSYSNMGDAEKAREWYNKVEFEKINDANVLYNLGTDFYNMSKFDEALKYYKRAVEHQGDFLDALYQMGLTYLSLGKNPEALVTFENYLKRDPDSQRAAQVKGFIEYLKK
jgi:TolA-binding protein